MISKLSVENFKSHALAKITLNRVTALVGPNGCGKTSLLLAIYYLTQASEGVWQHIFHDNRSPFHLVRRGCKSFRVALEGKEATNKDGLSNALWRLSITFTLAPDQSGTSPRYEPEVEWQFGSESGRKKLEQGLQLSSIVPKPALQAMGQSAYFKAAAQNLALPSYSEMIPPQIAPDGSGLASVVAYLMTYDSDRHKAIEAALRSIVPTVERVRAKPAKVSVKESRIISVNGASVPFDESRALVGHELIFDTTSAKEVPAHAMSEGTLLVLGILTLLWSPASPQVILLDDVEQGLHPQAQRELICVLKEFAEKQNRQIIITSHSPYILDALSADDVYVMTTNQQGTSITKRLSDHPDAKRALSVLTTGEFWDAEGESWVIKKP